MSQHIFRCIFVGPLHLKGLKSHNNSALRNCFEGCFTEAQRALYMAVLEVQKICISMCTTEYSLGDIYTKMLELLGQQLIRLGVINKTGDKNYFNQVRFVGSAVAQW